MYVCMYVCMYTYIYENYLIFNLIDVLFLIIINYICLRLMLAFVNF